MNCNHITQSQTYGRALRRLAYELDFCCTLVLNIRACVLYNEDPSHHYIIRPVLSANPPTPTFPIRLSSVRPQVALFGGTSDSDSLIKVLSRVAPLIFAPQRIQTAFVLRHQLTLRGDGVSSGGDPGHGNTCRSREDNHSSIGSPATAASPRRPATHFCSRISGLLNYRSSEGPFHSACTAHSLEVRRH